MDLKNNEKKKEKVMLISKGLCSDGSFDLFWSYSDREKHKQQHAA